ncbi:MAG: Signal recognition particle 19 kDa protein [Candidatus Thorarchaeota archaeon]|nr:MAG: Signal recognition particle 19 kDa protein [Candidatus Thorarchaeota archaeon]
MRPKKDAVIVWPAYLDSKLSRSEGRRIPSNLAAPDINIGILKEAAEAAGFDFEVDPEKRYPRSWYHRPGYLILQNPEGHKKKRLLLMLAKSLRRVVALREAKRKQAEKKRGKRRRRRR